MKTYATVISLVLAVYACSGNEQRVAALERRVSVAEGKIKKLESSAVPTAATTAQDLTSAVVAESGVARQSEQVLPQATTSTAGQSQIALPPPTPPPPQQTFSGVGKAATRVVTLQEGLYVFRLSHSGRSNFIVHLLDSDGRRVEGLVNVIGPFDGSKAVRVPQTGQYVLDVDADGAWTVVAGPPAS